jgi:hypothetical protein
MMIDTTMGPAQQMRLSGIELYRKFPAELDPDYGSPDTGDGLLYLITRRGGMEDYSKTKINLSRTGDRMNPLQSCFAMYTTLVTFFVSKNRTSSEDF